MNTYWRAHSSWFSFVVVLALTWAGLWLAGLWFEQSEPVEIRVVSAQVLGPSNGTTERTLRVEIVAPPASTCLRLSQQFLYRDAPGTPTFYPLGSSMSSADFNVTESRKFGMRAPPRKPLDFVLMFAIPASLPDGRYLYVLRNMYTCHWLGGILRRRILFEVPPIQIRLGPT